MSRDARCFIWGEMWLTVNTDQGIPLQFRFNAYVPERDPHWLGNVLLLGTDFLRLHHARVSIDADAVVLDPAFAHPCGELVVP